MLTHRNYWLYKINTNNYVGKRLVITLVEQSTVMILEKADKSLGSLILNI